MESLAKVLFLLGALPTIGGIAILVALAPKPEKIADHIKGVSRYLMVFGMSLAAARVLMGWSPPWDVVALSFGLGVGMGMHARDINLIALAQERLENSEAPR